MAALTDWRLVLCDLNGVALSVLTSIARGRQLSLRLNRPSSLVFTVPSDDPKVATVHTDGMPLLEDKVRVVKAFRKELGADGRYHYVIRFTGYVWQLQDDGDADGAHTQVTCYDPLQLLSKRLCRDSLGVIKHSAFATDAAQIAKALVDRTISYAGPCGIVTDGVFETSPSRTVDYAYQQIAAALTDLTNAVTGFDLVFTPLDRSDGILVRMNCYARAGSTKPDAVFNWGVGRRNVARVSRLKDGETLANSIIGLGATQSGDDQLVSAQVDTASVATYLRHEDVDAISEITHQDYLDALISEELSFRKQPRETVAIVPQAGLAPVPWDDFYLGDTITVNAAKRLRGGFTGQQRVYGIDLGIRDDQGEVVDQFIVSPN